MTINDIIQKILEKSSFASIVSTLIILGAFLWFQVWPAKQESKDYCDSQIMALRKEMNQSHTKINEQLENIKTKQEETSSKINSDLSMIIGQVNTAINIIRGR